MGRILLALRTFFLLLMDPAAADQIQRALTDPKRQTGTSGDESHHKKRPDVPKPIAAPVAPAPTRSEAITLLATLQRDARLIDFVQEPLSDYSDAQIGAAAREIHRNCGAVLQRIFALQPIVAGEENKAIEIPAGFQAGAYRLTGNPDGNPPFQGILVHQGWRATRCEMATWSGSPEVANVVAPAEVEVNLERDV